MAEKKDEKIKVYHDSLPTEPLDRDNVRDIILTELKNFRSSISSAWGGIGNLAGGLFGFFTKQGYGSYFQSPHTLQTTGKTVPGNDFGRIFVDATVDRVGLTGAHKTPSWIFDLPQFSQKAIFESTGPGLVYNTRTSAFTEGLKLTGLTSGATATITAVFPDTADSTKGTLYLANITGTFTNSEVVTDSSGGSATVTRATYRYTNAILRLYGVGGQEVRSDASKVVFDRWGAVDMWSPMRMFTWDASYGASTDPETLSCFAQEGFIYERLGTTKAFRIYLNGAWRDVGASSVPLILSGNQLLPTLQVDNLDWLMGDHTPNPAGHYARIIKFHNATWWYASQSPNTVADVLVDDTTEDLVYYLGEIWWWNGTNWQKSARSGLNSDITALLGLNTQNAIKLLPYGPAAGQTSEINLFELAANGTDYIGLKAPDSIATSTVYVLPNANGSAGDVLTIDTGSKLKWDSNVSTQTRKTFYTNNYRNPTGLSFVTESGSIVVCFTAGLLLSTPFTLGTVPILLVQDSYFSNQSGFNNNPKMSFSFKFYSNSVNVPAGDLWALVSGILSHTGSAIQFTSDHIGVKINHVSSPSGNWKIYGTQTSGGTNSSVELATASSLDYFDVIIEITSGTSVSYYIRRNGGALSAAYTLATNVPTGTNQGFSYAFGMNDTTHAAHMVVSNVSYTV